MRCATRQWLQPDAALHAGQLAAGRLQRISLECRLTTVSEIVRDNHLAKVDLLKIDAERSELEILAGIADEDWTKIEQIVLEVHDQPTLEQVEVLLAGRGYHCTWERGIVAAGVRLPHCVRRPRCNPGGESGPVH